jgi:hypothetical protein
MLMLFLNLEVFALSLSVNSYNLFTPFMKPKRDDIVRYNADELELMRL